MKLTVQLYIGSSQVELFDDETISVTSSIQNVKDIGKVFTDFSQSFSVPASRNNNKIFKHFYNFDVDNGFDARYKVDAELQINYMPFRKGKIRLDGVQMKNNKAYAYKLTFFGNTITLKDLLGEDLLSDIDFSDYDVPYDFANVSARVSTGKTVNGVSDAIIVPLISSEQRWYYDSSITNESGNLYDDVGNGADWDNLKYAIKLYSIIKEIENNYSISNGYPVDLVFSNDFFADNATDNPDYTDFYNLYMWLHRTEGKFDTSVPSFDYIKYMPNESWRGVYMSGTTFSINDIFSFGAEKYNVTFNLYTTSTSTFDIILLNGTNEVFRETKTGSTNYSINFGDITENGFYKIKIEYQSIFDITTSSYISMVRTEAVSGATSSNTFGFLTQLQTLSASLTFFVTDNMPQIKVIDFLTGIFKMFNLTAYESEGVIVVKPLDKFYENPEIYDITKYVDVDETLVRPASIFKQINFTYDGLGSYLTKKHNELFNYNWGEAKYSIENKYDGGIYSVVLPFEHMKYEKLYDVNGGSSTNVLWGWMVDSLDDNNVPKSYIGKPLLFYGYNFTSGTAIRLKHSNGSISKTQYWLPMNSKDIVSSQNIHFNAEINEYTNSIFEDTLFQKYYSNYISGVFSQKLRLTTITAYLPLKILSKYTLADTFIINQKSYRINSISTDLATGKSQIELLNIV